MGGDKKEEKKKKNVVFRAVGRTCGRSDARVGRAGLRVGRRGWGVTTTTTTRDIGRSVGRDASSVFFLFFVCSRRDVTTDARWMLDG